MAVLQNAGVAEAEVEVVFDAPHRFASKNVDFADASLAARNARLSDGAASFDRDLDKFADIKRVEPKA